MAALKLCGFLDRILTIVARIFSWTIVLLVLAVIYDVITRYFGLPKAFGINATQIQESEYWLHTMLFTTVIGYAYLRQAHVRIDLIRDQLSMKKKYFIELAGCVFLLIPYCIIGLDYTIDYTILSFDQGEVSKSGVGLTNTWIVKSFLPLMFVLLILAGVSQAIKAFLGLRGVLPESMISETLGGEN